MRYKVAKKESIKNSIEELMFFNFVDLPTIFCRKLSKETYFVSLGIQSECGKMWTRINPNTDTFYAVIFSYFTQPTPEGIYIFDIFLCFKRLIHSSNSYLGRVSCYKEALFWLLVSSTDLVLKVVPIEVEQYLCRVFTLFYKNLIVFEASVHFQRS